ncbi:MAG TPA: hypothetical protein VFW50_10325 [Streptosporangiaceae bacterium]|nr:hypothetical protein [Streptosporangiaceae bacterium]
MPEPPPQAPGHAVPQAPGQPVPQAPGQPAPQAPGWAVPGRRALIASAAALPLLLAATGCRSSDAFAGPDPLAGRPPLGHDVLTLQAVITAEENLIALYRTAIGADQGAATRLRTLKSLLSQHEQHLAQLKTMLVIPPGMSPSPARPAASTPAASTPASASGSATASPRAARVSTARLRAAERASAASLVRQLGAVSPALAQLFASIAASDASHVTALGG